MDNEKEEPTFDLDRVLCPSFLNCAGPLAVLSTYAGLCASIFWRKEDAGSRWESRLRFQQPGAPKIAWRC
jgi:hypothetical protein